MILGRCGFWAAAAMVEVMGGDGTLVYLTFSAVGTHLLMFSLSFFDFF